MTLKGWSEDDGAPLIEGFTVPSKMDEVKDME